MYALERMQLKSRKDGRTKNVVRCRRTYVLNKTYLELHNFNDCDHAKINYSATENTFTRKLFSLKPRF